MSTFSWNLKELNKFANRAVDNHHIFAVTNTKFKAKKIRDTLPDNESKLFIRKWVEMLDE